MITIENPTTIQINKTTRENLQEIKLSPRQTYDELLFYLISFVKDKNFKKYMLNEKEKEILKNENYSTNKRKD